ncbi:MAG: hypothetical protein J6Y97_04415 [Prevotella sp.]|nr:hypothetical protein [Prevotella sp.]
MKQLFISMILVLMSMTVSMPTSAKTGNETKRISTENIIVKQTTCFDDGRVLTIYYEKQGKQCMVYSPCDVNTYTKDDVSKIKSTNLEIVDKAEGKLYRKATMGEIMRVLKQLSDQL